MYKIFLFLAIFLLNTSAYSQSIDKIDLAIAQEIKNVKHNGCDPVTERILKAISPDNNNLLISIPYESCGGGNNWGFSTVLLANFDGKKWLNKQIIVTSTVDKIYLDKNKQKFMIETLEYKDSDPRCCPSLKKIQSVDFINAAPTSHPFSNIKISKNCTIPNYINNLFDKAFTYRNNHYVKNSNFVKEPYIQEISTQNHTDHSILSINLLNSKFFDIPVISISKGNGHENGIGYFFITLDSSKENLLNTLKNNGFKLKNNQISIDEFTTLSVSQDKKAKAIFLCDWSN